MKREIQRLRGGVAKEMFRVSRPGAGVCTLPGVGVEGAVAEACGSGDLGFGYV